MSKVTVYNFRKYDISKDDYDVSRRMATIEAVRKLGDGFSIVEGTGKEIDDSELDPNMDGMTPISSGFLEFCKQQVEKLVKQ